MSGRLAAFRGHNVLVHVWLNFQHRGFCLTSNNPWAVFFCDLNWQHPDWVVMLRHRHCIYTYTDLSNMEFVDGIPIKKVQLKNSNLLFSVWKRADNMYLCYLFKTCEVIPWPSQMAAGHPLCWPVVCVEGSCYTHHRRRLLGCFLCTAILKTLQSRDPQTDHWLTTSSGHKPLTHVTWPLTPHTGP